LPTIPEALEIAEQALSAGDCSRARLIYERILAAVPDEAHSLNGLGVIAFRAGRFGEAAELYHRAIALLPDNPAFYNNLNLVCCRQGKAFAAIKYGQRALELAPNAPELHCNLGSAWRLAGQWELAKASFRRAMELKADYHDARYHLALLYIDTNRLDEAVRELETVLAASPDDPHALDGLGVVAFRRGRFDEAESLHRRAIARLATDPAFHNNLNLVCCQLGRPEEAVEHCRRALALSPDSPELHNNLGLALRHSGQLALAEPSFRRAVALKPEAPYFHHNLGVTLVYLHRLDEAAEEYARAVSLAPSDANARFSQALLWLMQGDYERGWPQFEWRFGMEGFTRPDYAQPRWQGEPIDGRTILLTGEQGLGDIIQMIRFVPLVKERGATVFVECKPQLHALLASMPAIDRLIASGAGGGHAFDYQLPLLSLPGVLRTTLETIPSTIPYLSADPKRVLHWKERLGESPGVRVGIAWQGRATHGLDRFRSIPLVQFAPLAACQGVRLYSLQVGHGREQLAEFSDRAAITDLGLDLDDYAETAAIMCNLDLVISCDSSPAHLAGALGVPVWVAVPFTSDWRWLVEREDSPWYPTMRIFRQSLLGDWNDVFGRMAETLQSLVNARACR
jgi:Flp pilus assembly protein TadD